MIECQKCGAEMQDGVKFCRGCGNSLDVKKKYCSNCGAIIINNTNFCSECGTTYGISNNSYANKKVRSGSGQVISIASLALAILGLPFFSIPSIIGLVLGIVGIRKRKEAGQSAGLATAGFVISVIGVVIWIILLAMGAGASYQQQHPFS